jgi:hypothetical protein
MAVICKMGDPAVPQLSREQRRLIATEFVAEINSKTVCAHCSAQPIVWHGEHHPEKPNARISSLRTQGCSVERIQQEMDVCTPLCRGCHMREDGRYKALRAASPFQPGVEVVPPKPCLCCAKVVKITRRGMCSGCYNCETGLRPHKQKRCGDMCCYEHEIEEVLF